MTNLVTTTPSRFSVIRPELLPPMQVLQSLDSEAIITARMTQFKTLWDSYDPPNAATYDVGNTEFDPIKINQELNAFFETLVRDRVNQACRAVTLAFAIGSDLDAIASRYPYGVPRLPNESDPAYRVRVWNSPSIFSLNGPGQGVYESYVFWALSAPMPLGTQPLKHASGLTLRGTGNVYIPILNSSPNYNTTWTKSLDGRIYTLDPQLTPLPSKVQISTVYEYITDATFARQGLTDVVNIVSPKVKRPEINVKIWLFPGVDKDTLMGEVTAAVSALIGAINWLGADLTMLSLQGALAQAGVYNSQVLAPTADVIVGMDGAVQVTLVTLTYMGQGE
jgi:phage-related baseplate assembly protein